MEISAAPLIYILIFVAVIALATVAASLLRESKAGFALAWDQAGVWVGVGLMLFTLCIYGLRIVQQRVQDDGR